MSERCERTDERVAQYSIRLFLNHSAHRTLVGAHFQEFLKFPSTIYQDYKDQIYLKDFKGSFTEVKGHTIFHEKF